MRIFFPNSAHLMNFGGFARKQDPSDPSHLSFSMASSYVSVHPVVIAMAAAQARYVHERGGKVEVDFAGSDRSVQYLSRMKLTDILGVDPGLSIEEHAPEGRFIPVTQVRDQNALNDFIIDMVPLLHAQPGDAGPIKFVISELVRNVLEHAVSPVEAMVCAQYFGNTKRLSIGVADLGIGIRKSLSVFHAVPSDIDAIHLALRPGITGTTPRFGGNEQNAGAGLFLTKSIARASRNYLVVYSGSAMFKLRQGPAGEQPVLFSDPVSDRATRETDLPDWPGTAIGIDISVTTESEFSALLSAIRDAYHMDIKAKKKAKYKRPRFR